jgi:hypothetical protein
MRGQIKTRLDELKESARTKDFWARVTSWWLRGKLKKLIIAAVLGLLLYSVYAVEYLDFALGTGVLPEFITNFTRGPVETVDVKSGNIRVEDVLSHPSWGPCLEHMPPACKDGASRRPWGLLTVSVRNREALGNRITVICTVTNKQGSVAGTVRHTFYARSRKDGEFPAGSISKANLGFTMDPEWTRFARWNRGPKQLNSRCEVVQAR